MQSSILCRCPSISYHLRHPSQCHAVSTCMTPTGYRISTCAMSDRRALGAGGLSHLRPFQHSSEVVSDSMETEFSTDGLYPLSESCWPVFYPDHPSPVEPNSSPDSGISFLSSPPNPLGSIAITKSITSISSPTWKQSDLGCHQNLAALMKVESKPFSVPVESSGTTLIGTSDVPTSDAAGLELPLSVPEVMVKQEESPFCTTDFTSPDTRCSPQSHTNRLERTGRRKISSLNAAFLHKSKTFVPKTLQRLRRPQLSSQPSVYATRSRSRSSVRPPVSKRKRAAPTK
ncbi:unnamed protein product [Dicrocoelium dendriticum]|nr:unnamed protein product [Dicrocoelium dendriticum]